jgi:hypothetical protein
MSLEKQLQDLVKTITAGTYDVAPSALRQGPSLNIEDCSPLYHNQTFENKHIFLQKDLQIKKAKSPTVQFVRRLSYGHFGGSAQLEGAVGSERTSDWTRVAVPMCYYSEIRRVTVAATLIETQGGDKIEDLEAEGGELNLAGDIEFDLFRGCDDFTNAGTFDGNPNVVPALANMRGLQLQVRQADAQVIAQDLMFLAYGAGLASEINVSGTLDQSHIEDASVRSSMNHGTAELLVVDPLVQSAYNKIAYLKERIILSGSPQEMTGADLRRQSTYNGMIQVKASRFLSGKFRPNLVTGGAPGQPTISSTSQAAGTTGFTLNDTYTYFVTAENEFGEGPASASSVATITTTGNQVTVNITAPSGTTRFYNVYRSPKFGTTSSARFLGRVIAAASPTFVDLGNKLPGFVTGVLYQPDTMWIAELAPYSRMKLAVSDLSLPEAHFRFLTLCVGSPKKNVLMDNLIGSL